MTRRLVQGLPMVLVAFLLARGVAAQGVDHWETVVYDADTWRYLVPVAEPDPAWRTLSFDHSGWPAGPGGFGYGDDDDGTVVAPTLSVYQRIVFTLADTSTIAFAVLHVDYDDAFVAYLNGVEIGRGTIGTPGDHPAFDQPADGLHEADLYRGRTPGALLLSRARLTAILKPGDNLLAVQTHNQSLASSDLTSRVFFSVGLTDTSTPYRRPPPWFSPPPTEPASVTTHLPLILIDTEGQVIPDEPKVRARMKVVDNGAGRMNAASDSATAYDGFIGIELRGRSSQGFPKQSYAVETRDADGNDIDVDLLGLPEEEDWVLYAPYSDKSLMRNVLIFRLARRLGRYATRTRFVELLLNDDYRGVYVLMERIKRDKNRVDISRLDPEDRAGDDLTGGYIVKIDGGVGEGQGWVSPYPPRPGLDRRVSYSFHIPDASTIVPEQATYIEQAVAAFEDAMASDHYADPAQGYARYLDVDAAVDYFILHELARNVDAYRISTYLYKDRDSIGGGKLVFGPLWDFNFSFGNVDYYGSGSPMGFQVESGVPDSDGAHPPFWWEKLWEDPPFNARIIARWTALRRGPLHTDSLMQFIDETAVLLEEPAARNFERWKVLGSYVWPNAFVGNTYAEEVDYLKGWMVDRLAWMDAHLERVTDAELPALFPDGYTLGPIYPNPVRDQAAFTLRVGRSQTVRAHVYDLLGRRVATLYDDRLESGTPHTFTLSGRALAGGLYIVRVAGDTFAEARKVVVVR